MSALKSCEIYILDISEYTEMNCKNLDNTTLQVQHIKHLPALLSPTLNDVSTMTRIQKLAFKAENLERNNSFRCIFEFEIILKTMFSW